MISEYVLINIVVAVLIKSLDVNYFIYFLIIKNFLLKVYSLIFKDSTNMEIENQKIDKEITRLLEEKEQTQHNDIDSFANLSKKINFSKFITAVKI